MKKLIPILLILVIPIISLGEKVNIRKAKKVAQRIYKLDKPDKDELKIENFITLGNNNDTLLYVFSYPDDGFVIISAEDAAPPVLGHCKKGKYEPENMPGGLLYLIEKYQYSISSLREKKSVASEKIKKQWINILNDDSQLKSYTIGTTLLSTSWGQEDGYNDECPNEWPAGCTAVAMAQILRRWGCQIDPSGSVNYQYGSISFGDYTYNWEDMNDGSPDDDNAQLIYHAGVSCLTNYGSNSSTSLPWKARNGFVDFWGIDSDADLKWRIWHLSNWQDMLEDEIDLERPILYSAASGSSGHSWVIDGYEQDGDFWCNWGWNGDFNGPFSLGFELPGDMGSYNQIESAIFNVEPEQPNGVAKPELSNNTFLYNPSGYNLTMDEAFGATEYEWITTYGSISGTTNSVTLNTERTTVVSVRAYNEICDIYSPMENATISITYGPVSGSGSLCSSGSNYTLTNVPTGYSVTWSATPSYKFQTSSGTGTTAFLQPTSSAYGDGTITFTILGQNYSKPFTINPPDPSDVSLSLYTSGGSPASYMCPDTYYHIYINNSGGCSLSNYSWSIPAAWDSMYQSSNMISVYTNSTPGGMVEVDAYISCCNETRKVITDYLYSGYCGGYYSMIFTPNPSELETTLSIESTKEEVQFDDNEEWELEVYDQTQILKEKKNKIKGSKYKIKTQSWKEGIYIVRVKYKDEILQGKLVVKK